MLAFLWQSQAAVAPLPSSGGCGDPGGHRVALGKNLHSAIECQFDAGNVLM
jgi:hypothetical protein